MSDHGKIQWAHMPTLINPRIGPRELKRLTPPPLPLPYQPQERDFAALAFLARVRFADTAQIAAHVGGSPRVVQRRLYLMWSHGLVYRPEEQATLIQTYFHHGDTPRIWALSREGVRVLVERGHELARRLDWGFRPVSAANLPHTLDTAGFVLALHREVAMLGSLSLRDHHDCIEGFPERTRTSRRPFSIAVEVPLEVKTKNGTRTDHVRLTNVPDRVFELHFDGGTRANFTVEIDRGTQSHNAKRITTKSNTRRKQLVYFHAFKQGRFEHLFGWQRQRCLFVTTSERRLDNLIANQVEVTDGALSGMFLYATPDRIARHGVLGPAWKSAETDGLSILPTTLLLQTPA